MSKDEELLLGLEKGSDSDEVVEEFKLPPPRSRRKRNKLIPDARVSSGGSSLITWRCCFSFIVLSLLVAGGLVLAYYIYNMHLELVSLQKQFESSRSQSNSILGSCSRKVTYLELKQKEFVSFKKSHDSNYEKLQKTVQELIKKEGQQDKDGLTQHLNTLETDVEAMKNGMAKSGAELEKTQKYMLSMEETFKNLQKKFNTIKLEAMNPTTPNKDTHVDNDEYDTANYMTRAEVNVMFKKFDDDQVDQSTEQTKATLALISNLKLSYAAINVTHNSDMLRLTKSVLQMKNQFETFQGYEPIILELKNATRHVFKELHAHKLHVEVLGDELQEVNNTLSKMKAIAIATPSRSATLSQTNTSTSTNPPARTPSTTTKSGPVLPDERNRYASIPTDLSSTTTTTATTTTATTTTTTATTGTKTTTTTPPVAVNVTGANGKASEKNVSSHLYITPPKVVHEQTAKNESEIDYKNFETAINNDTAATASTATATTASDDNSPRKPMTTNSTKVAEHKGRNVGILENPTNPSHEKDTVTTDDRGNVPEGNSAGPPYDGTTGVDNGKGDEDEEDTRSSVREKLLHMSDSEKRELLQTFLSEHGNQYPYNQGDKK